MSFSIILLVVFFTIMIGIGLWGMKKTTSLNDFFLGGRSIGPWVSAMAYGTTYFSAVAFIGFAGKLGWVFGLQTMWIVAGNAFIGAFLAWMVLARRTRRMTMNLDAMTMPEFLQERYNGKYTKIFSAIVIFIFLLPYSASVFKGLGHLFEANFHISFDLALLIMIGITGIYLVLGGYFAITLTDFLQGFVMIIGSIAMVSILVSKGGGFNEVIDKINMNHLLHVPLEKRPPVLLLISLVFMTSFGTWGLPQMVQKFYSVKNEQVITKAAIATFFFALIIGFAAYFTGSMAHIFFDKLPIINGAPAFDRIVPDLLTQHLPEKLMALILLLVLSASMSTLSSLVLVSSSAIAIDLYKGHVNTNVSADNSLVMMRFLSTLFIIISFFIARYEFAIIITLMSLSWGAVAGTFMAAYIYGLYWKRTTLAGAAAGMISGLTTAVTLFFVLGPANSPIASSIAMIVPFFVIPAVSMFTKAPDKELIDKAFNGI
ncbi:MAG: sodium transporter [Spirochaetae bacterium HGW-Spirochaetae-5]|nr:MAG: sodium transporter [Spirochaetae bacterium HGW-Spirochaetae-5]